MPLSKDMKRKLSGNNPEITLDLAKLMGVEKLPEDNLLKQALGQAIVDKIKDNTLHGDFLAQKGNKNESAQKYSDEYAHSFEFKVYGKSKSDVNLKASGDMLSAISFDVSDSDKMSIYFNDELEAAKAHGHITGNVGKKRDFFGLNNSDLQAIADQFKRPINKALDEQAPKIIHDTTGEDDLNFVIGLLKNG